MTALIRERIHKMHSAGLVDLHSRKVDDEVVSPQMKRLAWQKAVAASAQDEYEEALEAWYEELSKQHFGKKAGNQYLSDESWERVVKARSQRDFVLSDYLLKEAKALDLVLPTRQDEGNWMPNEPLGGFTLTPKARLALRQTIDAEKLRRYEFDTKWVKLWIPVITALTGLIGVITGLVAVLTHAK